MDNTQEFRCLSLCTGYAGIELGLRRVIPNLRTVAYVEVEAFACANLVAKMEAGLLDVAPIWTDIKTFGGQPFYKRVHIVTAGYPCQPFSVAGKQKGAKDPRHLWPYIARIVQAVRPVWCFFENVPGHLTIGFPEVYRSLRDLGYKVEAGLFTAAECRAPQRRQRLFILAGALSDGQCGILRQTGQRTHWAQQRTNPDRQGFRDGRKRAPRELADTNSDRTQRDEPERITQAGGPADQYGEILWPSRPGQPQYEWEEPRVVGYAPRKRLSKRTRGQMGRCGTPEQESKRPNGTTKNGQAQSRLGRESDGSIIALDIAKGIRGGYYVKPGGELGHDLVLEAKMRVDRLRLLGNGVVPQQAELAFRYLIEVMGSQWQKE